MSDHVYHVTEVVGSSTTSVDDAIRKAIQRSARTLRNLDWFEMTEIRGSLANGEIERFQVTLKVGFRLEELD
jgi:flavin-binding protein dodecin